jgi:hypothetical protein
MKLFAITIMLIALFLLYRIAYPKQQTNTKKDNEVSSEKLKFLPDVMGKSRFVLPDRSKPLQTPATLRETEKEVEKESIFAAKTEENRLVAIPAEQFDEVFDDNSNPEIMSVPLEDESEIDFEAEEAEELGKVLGYEPILAEGMDYDDLQAVVKVVKEQPDEVSEETAETITALENTDMFEMLASGNEGREDWIKSVVERRIRIRIPETESKISDTADYGDFVADFLVEQ